MNAASSATQIRNRSVFVRLPGTDLSIEVRRPDPVAMIAQNVLPLETFSGILDIITEWAATGEGPDVLTETRKKPKVWGAFIDRWVCAAAVSPRIVIDEADAISDDTKLWVDDLDLDVKLEIMRVTNSALRSPRLGDAVKEFRRVRPEGAGAGPGGAAVRDETLAAPADPGSGAGAGL